VEKPVVIVHRKTQVDEENCKALGYEVVESYNNGSTVVSNAGDVLIGHFAEPELDPELMPETEQEERNWWCDRFATYFVEWLKGKGLNAVYEENEVLVDDYKVCVMCVTRYGRIDYTGRIISMNVNLDHMKQICRKPMKKVPKGLSEYGITTEEVEQMFVDFCEQDEQNQ
jgi:lipoate-protein ligase A